MGLFDFMRSPDINEGVKACAATPGAVLLDVRDRDEYAAGHIPGSVNLPLSEIRSAEDRFPDVDTPLFVYCLSGAQQQGNRRARRDGLHETRQPRRHPHVARGD